MIAQQSVLVQLVRLVERLPAPPPPPPRRGRPHLYSDALFLKALVIMILRRLNKVGELLAVLEEPTEEMRALRELLSGAEGRFPSRRTFQRRLRALPDTLPERIGLLGRHLVGLLKPWAKTGEGGRAGLHGALRQGRGVAQEGQGGRRGAPFFDRHPSRLDQVGLARVGLWVQAAFGVHGGRGVDSALAARLTPANVHDTGA
jgi:hypothetical protein